MSWHESVLDNFAGDLEYHPRRAAIYLTLATLSFCTWILSPVEAKFTTVPLVFALGSLTLFLKGAYLLRRSSEGLGLSEQDLKGLSRSSNHKPLPSLPAQVAQVVQDFGAGSLFLCPLLNLGKDINSDWTNPPQASVFWTGAVLFALGWVIRRLTTHTNELHS